MRRLVTLSQGVAVNPDASALLARYTTPPSATFRAATHRLFNKFAAAGAPINSSGPWDLAYILCAETEQASLLHAFNASFNATKVNSPVFTSSHGWNGVTSPSNGYIRTNFTPSVNAAKALAGGRTSIVASLSYRAGASSVLFGANSAGGSDYIYNRYTDNKIYSQVIFANSGSAGIFIRDYVGVNSVKLFKDGVARPQTTGASVAVGLPTREIYICANNDTGGAVSISSDVVPIFLYGARITDAQKFLCSAAIQEFLVSIGAVSAPNIYAFDGDSLVYGDTAPQDGFPIQYEGLIGPTGRPIIYQTAVNGLTMLDLIAKQQSVNDLLAMPHQSATLFVLEHVNALRQTSVYQTVPQLITSTAQYCEAARAAGWDKIYIVNATPAGPPLYANNWQAGAWDTYNTALDAAWSGFADGIVDMRTITQLQDYTNTTYFDSDQLHRTAAGYALVAAACYAKI